MMTTSPRVTAALALSLCTLSACAGASDAPTGGAGVVIDVAALTLPGVTNARYTIEIVNDAGDTVATKTLDSLGYGGGDGSVSYVAPCDADSNPNAVTVTLLDVYAGTNGTTVIDRSSYQNPGPMPRTVDCVANADVPLTWDVTLVRAASQGFFDVAVSFRDIFCSAKVDCVDSAGDPLKLLFDASGQRARTVVAGLACTATVGDGVTYLYRDDLVVDCGTAGAATVDPSAGPGNLASDAGISDPSGRLFAAAVARGEEQLGFHKVYWNVMLGLGPQTTACTLTTRATATDSAFTNGTTPSGTTWPIIAVDLPLTDASGALVCTRHPVNSATSPGVETAYTPLDTPEVFAYAYAPATAPVLSTPSDATLSGADTVVNDYAALTSDVAVGATVLPVSADIATAGDEVLVMQAQGSGTTAGTWELAVVTGASAGSLQLSAGLQHAYTSGTFDQGGAQATQVIRVARYANLTLSGTVTAPAWDGTTGGVVAIEATGAVTFSGGGAIHVDGKGFRGGPRENLGHLNGRVGEGVLGNPGTRCLDETTVPASLTGGCGAIEGSYDSNDGVSVSGGGSNEASLPQDGVAYGGRLEAKSGARYRVGDFDALVLGGGGGQGDSGTNDYTTLAPGGAGGGVVLLIAPQISAPAVTADGASGANSGDYYGSGGDWGNSGGGGGAGGAIQLQATTVTGGTLSAAGGAGGATYHPTNGTFEAQSKSGGAGRVRVTAPFSGASTPASH